MDNTIEDLHKEYMTKIDGLITAFQILLKQENKLPISDEKHIKSYKDKMADIYKKYKENAIDFSLYGEKDKQKVFVRLANKVINDFTRSYKNRLIKALQVNLPPKIIEKRVDVPMVVEKAVPLYVIPENYAVYKIGKN